jgi:sterol desaturase/sphingolipid hydroxylase (fatty acid hydroxylase superfamily)
MWWYSAALLGGWFLLLFVAERLFPRRELGARDGIRIANNMGLGLLNTLILRFGVPISVIGVATWARHYDLGLWNLLEFSGPLEILVSFLVLDLAVWFQHYLSHRLDWFWRLHRVHHLDVEFDVTTAIRFHPVEILVSLVYKCVIVTALGASSISVLILEFMLAAGAMFNHANLSLPVALDRVVRLVIVTPDMHRVHHSVLRKEHDRNYGFFLSVWDRIFSTYCDQPSRPHQSMSLGLAYLRDSAVTSRADRMLVEPLVTRPQPHG